MLRKNNPISKVATSLKAMKQRHLVRHQPSGLGFAFADRIDFLDPARWDAVCGGQSVWMRRSVLRAIEQAGPDNLTPCYALIFQGNEPIAAIAAQVLDVDGSHVHNADAEAGKAAVNLKRKLLSAAKTMAAKSVKQRLLVAGNVLCWGFHGIAISPTADQQAAWAGISEAIYRLRRGLRLTGETNIVMVKDLTPEQPHVEALRTYSYRPLETEPNMMLDIQPSWQSYDDYLAALDSKYRSNAKSQIKKLAAAGCTIQRLESVMPVAEQLHQLYLAVHGNAQLRLVRVPPTFLTTLEAALGDDFRCHVVRRDEEILGFVTCIRDGDTAIAYHIGFDHAAASQGIPLYLRLLHATIGDAIDWHCRRISLGRTALEPKASMGAKPQPMTVWMRHRIPAVNFIVRGLLEGIDHAEPPERNPFKKPLE